MNHLEWMQLLSTVLSFWVTLWVVRAILIGGLIGVGYWLLRQLETWYNQIKLSRNSQLIIVLTRKCDMMAQALIIIDMQRALVALDRREAVLNTINQRIDQYHQAKRPVIFIQHTEPGMAVTSPGWQLFPELHVLGTDTFYNKTRPDAFYQTGLEAFLKMNQLQSIEICGAQVEFCVDTTIRVAYHLGFHLELLMDGITTMNSDLLTAAQIKQHHQQIWNHRFGELVTVATPLQ